MATSSAMVGRFQIKRRELPCRSSLLTYCRSLSHHLAALGEFRIILEPSGDPACACAVRGHAATPASMVSLSRRRRRRGRSLHRFPHGHRLPDCTSALLNQRITVAQQCHSGAGFYGLILGECAGGKAFSRRKFGALSWHLELCQRGGCSERESDSNDDQSHHYSEVLVDSGRDRH